MAQILAEIDHAGLRESSDAKTAAISQIHFIGIHFKNSLLRIALLQFEAQHRFRDLSPPVAIGAQEIGTRHLHGNGAGTLQVRAMPQVIPRRAKDADEIETWMFEEAFIFRGEDGVNKIGRQIVVTNCAPLFSGNTLAIIHQAWAQAARHHFARKALQRSLAVHARSPRTSS